jgi:hypothetical protein
MSAIEDIAAERRRQIEVEWWTPAHDDGHDDSALAKAAACYALSGTGVLAIGRLSKKPDLWPWDWKWWKPSDRRRDLVKAGALIVAEIERLDRAAASEAANG